MTKPVKRKKKANIGAKSNVAKQKRKERQFMDESLSQAGKFLFTEVSGGYSRTIDTH